MAEVTWKATLIGAVILFLIGLVVATCINYSKASLESIKAGLDGPFECTYDGEDRIKMLCNETEAATVHDCLKIYVEFRRPSNGHVTRHIRLALSYRYDHFEINAASARRKCSVDYCGKYRHQNQKGDYVATPELVQIVRESVKNRSGVIDCYLSPRHPEWGAYLYLNHAVEKPEHRMFRFYEGWIILILPIIVLFVIVLSLFILFIRGKLAALPVQRPKDAFVPPGFQPAPTSSSVQSSIKSVKGSSSAAAPVYV